MVGIEVTAGTFIAGVALVFVAQVLFVLAGRQVSRCESCSDGKSGPSLRAHVHHYLCVRSPRHLRCGASAMGRCGLTLGVAVLAVSHHLDALRRPSSLGM